MALCAWKGVKTLFCGFSLCVDCVNPEMCWVVPYLKRWVSPLLCCYCQDLRSKKLHYCIPPCRGHEETCVMAVSSLWKCVKSLPWVFMIWPCVRCQLFLINVVCPEIWCLLFFAKKIKSEKAWVALRWFPEVGPATCNKGCDCLSWLWWEVNMVSSG